MELDDLIGEHSLDAVDFSNEQVKTWGDQFEDCQVMRFRLDGVVYIATENPDDGYRSHMRDLTVGDFPMVNVFDPVRVVGRRKEKRKYQEDDILELIDPRTGQAVIEVGTANTDDYYPCFVANFDPEAIADNPSAN